jgi:HSP20 family protein
MAITDLIPWKKEEAKLPIVRQDPSDFALSLHDEMNHMFEDFFRAPFGMTRFGDFGSTGGGFNPQVDISETDKEYIVAAELPGLEEKDVQVSLSHHTLTISGEKKVEKRDKGKNFYRVERSFGTFNRSIPLPDEVDEDKIEAVFKNGVLTINLPKTTQAISQRKQITIKKG